MTFLASVSELVATAAGSFFVGGCIFASVVDVPAIRQLPHKEIPGYFDRFYHEAGKCQGSLLIISGLSGLFAAIFGGGLSFAVGAVCMFLVMPWTGIVMGPTIKQLIKMAKPDNEIEVDKTECLGLLQKWSRLHLARTAAGAIAATCFYKGLGLFSRLH